MGLETKTRSLIRCLWYFFILSSQSYHQLFFPRTGTKFTGVSWCHQRIRTKHKGTSNDLWRRWSRYCRCRWYVILISMLYVFIDIVSTLALVSFNVVWYKFDFLAYQNWWWNCSWCCRQLWNFLVNFDILVNFG